MADIILDPEFDRFFDPLSDDELALLEASIREHGCLDPLVVWKEQNILLDGYNRLRLLKKIGRPDAYRIVYVWLPDRAAAIEWMRNHQLGRRNVTPEKRAYLIGREYNAAKPPPGHPTAAQMDGGQPFACAAQVADKHGVSKSTVKEASRFSAAVDRIADPAQRQAVLDGTSGKSREQVVAENPPPATPKKKPAPLKNGQQLFDWTAFREAFGALYRQPDKLARAYRCSNTPRPEGFQRLLAEWQAAFKKWYKELTKLDAPKD